ncbi:MAG: hypothetical protein COB14_02310 [Alphaproteobacteria bacterium]|nr:MAG: hypothetical protein COB14_02310 [Alphaproteobacteria bacterium]
MAFWAFIKLPTIPNEFKDQTNGATLKKYCTKTGDRISKNSAIAYFETWWAVIELKTTEDIYIDRLFFAEPFSEISLQENDPIGTFSAEGDNIHKAKTYWDLKKHIRKK